MKLRIILVWFFDKLSTDRMQNQFSVVVVEWGTIAEPAFEHEAGQMVLNTRSRQTMFPLMSYMVKMGRGTQFACFVKFS